MSSRLDNYRQQSAYRIPLLPYRCITPALRELLKIDILEAGFRNGPRAKIFQPRPEVLLDFYKRHPADLAPAGRRNLIVEFTLDLSHLPTGLSHGRIVRIILRRVY